MSIKKKDTKILPKLRFPEFRDAGEWKDTQLDKIGQTISGLSGKSGSDFGSGKPYVTYMQVFNGTMADPTKCGLVTVADNEKQNTLNRGDILITTSSETSDEVGFASVLLDSPLEPLYLNSFCFSFRPNNLDELKPEFSRYLFRSPIYRKLISVLAQGSTRFNISKGSFLNLKLPIPVDFKEQQKIADCLSSLDDLINAQSQKLDALKAHKKGLMQKLFPGEGEKVPRLRFPEFRSKGEWEVGNLGEICKITSGGTPYRAEENYWNGNIPWITTSLIDFNTICTANEYITETALLNSSAKIFPKNTILMAMYGQGKTRGKVAILGIAAATNQACAAILLKDGFNTNFVFQSLATLYDHIRELSNDGGQKNLSAALIETIPFAYPNIKTNEQQKIADCLSSLDDLIMTQSQKLDILKVHKKGLMQGLFPAVNEINS